MSIKINNQFSVATKAIRFALRTNRKLFLVLIALHIFQGAIVYLQFSSFASIVDSIIKIKDKTGSIDDLIFSSATLGISFLLPSVAGNYLSFFRKQFQLQQDIQLDLHKIDKQASLDIGTLESSAFQNLLRSANEWGTGSVLRLQEFVFTTASNLASIITSMGILWSLSGWLMLFAILAAAPVYLFYKKYSLEVFRVRMLSVEDNRIITNRVSHFQELQKVVDIVLMKLAAWFKAQIESLMKDYLNKVMAAEHKRSISDILMSLWYLVSLFAAIALMTFDALTGNIAVAGLLLGFSTYTRFYQTINTFVESISVTEEATRYASHWFELFNLQPKIASNKNSVAFCSLSPPLIEFRDVCFGYAKEAGEMVQVLKNISFSINPGEKIAIVGTNGSGKTTLVKLLCRIYDPTDGAIFVNGTDLREIQLDNWQQSLGILFQNYPEYNLKIRESIFIGRLSRKVTDEALKEAARFSGADEFIDTFPNRYDQLIWKEFKDGTDLSRGQHQRLAVARLFYRNAAVTILDEPTASIDPVTEETIFRTLEDNMSGKTVILITHRFSSVKRLDKIVVLDRGQIVECGSHRELMLLNEKYAKLYNMQATRYT